MASFSLQDVFNDDHPFGPNISLEVNSVDIYRNIFQTENLLYKDL